MINHYCPNPISSQEAFLKAEKLLEKDSKVHVVFFCPKETFNEWKKSINSNISNIERICRDLSVDDKLFHSRAITPVVNSIKSQKKRVYLFAIEDINQYQKIVSSRDFCDIAV